MERVSREIALGRAQSKPLSVAFLDVDHFKKINDTHGHQVGDEVLREISGLIAREVRVGDCAIRYGGEEILVVLPATNATQAVAVIDRLRSALHVQRLSSKQIAVTFSAGIAEYSSGDRRKLLAVADKALYAAKNAGRDRSVVG
jgi:diguanylate cyclase (GGDEF)-like protein